MIPIKLIEYATPSTDNKYRLEWSNMIRFFKSSDYNNLLTVSDEAILFSLENFAWINADGLIWLLLIADELKSKDNSLWLDLPRNVSQLEYIKFSNFHEVAQQHFSITNLFYLDEIERNKPLTNMKFYKVDVNTLGSLLKDITSFLSLSGDFKEKMLLSGDIIYEYLPDFLGAIGETSKNIVQHSTEVDNSGNGYFVISAIGRNKISFCIADSGRGFRSSLIGKSVKTKSDFDAIKQALLYRYKLEGEGLFRVVQFISQLNGFLRIRSGNCETFLNVSKNVLVEDSDTKDFIMKNLMKFESSFNFPGVQIKIDVISDRI